MLVRLVLRSCSRSLITSDRWSLVMSDVKLMDELRREAKLLIRRGEFMDTLSVSVEPDEGSELSNDGT